jgi:hemolysin activation/secretion protein
MLIKKKLCFLTLSLILVASTLHSEHGKKLTIKGLKLFSEKELYSHLQLNRFEEGKIPLAQVIISIEKFYKLRNYPLVKVYAADVRTSSEYVLFVDEGRIGKIIVHNLNNYYSLKFKQQVKIPERIYNPVVVEQNLYNLKKKFPSAEITVELQQPPDYEGNLIQLDR